MSESKIFVCTHKRYQFPDDNGYIPLHVGKANSHENLPYSHDDTGENISNLNPYFCELTGIYWVWKNTKTSFVGFSHYRRYFLNNSFSREASCVHMGRNIYSSQGLFDLMQGYDIILPRERFYGVDTVQSHYKHSHYESDLLMMKKVITDRFPEYSEAVNKVLHNRSLTLFNMFVMPREKFNGYCQWIFSILFDLERFIPYRKYGSYQRRVFGFLSERLFNIWLTHNCKNMKIKRLSVVNLEAEPVSQKLINYLNRKILRKKPL